MFQLNVYFKYIKKVPSSFMNIRIVNVLKVINVFVFNVLYILDFLLRCILFKLKNYDLIIHKFLTFCIKSIQLIFISNLQCKKNDRSVINFIFTIKVALNLLLQCVLIEFVFKNYQ